MQMTQRVDSSQLEKNENKHSIASILLVFDKYLMLSAVHVLRKCLARILIEIGSENKLNK